MIRRHATTLILTSILSAPALGQQIHSLSTGWGTSGTGVTALGEGFGKKKGKVYLTSAKGHVKVPVTSWSATEIRFRIPKKKKVEPGSYELTLKPKGMGLVTTLVPFDIFAPILDTFDTSLSGVGLLGIRGHAFSATPKVEIDGVKAEVVHRVTQFGVDELLVRWKTDVAAAAHLVSVETGVGQAAKWASFGGPGAIAKKAWAKLQGAGVHVKQTKTPTAALVTSTGTFSMGTAQAGGFTMEIPGFDPGQPKTYTLTPGPGVHFKGNPGGDKIELRPGDVLQVSFTEFGGGQIGASFAGTVTRTWTKKGVTKEEQIGVTGSFVVNVGFATGLF